MYTMFNIMSVCETDVTKLAYVGPDSDNFCRNEFCRLLMGKTELWKFHTK